MRLALNQLAPVAPDWRQTLASEDWFERYGRRFDSFHLPDARDKRQALAPPIGRDGSHLLTQAFAPDAPEAVRRVPALEILRRIWVQPFYFDASGPEPELRMREPKDLPPAEQCIRSP